MLNYSPISDLNHYPGIAMGIYGLNPYQEPMYRIVFAPSRRTLTCGTFLDGSTGGKWLPEYGHIGDLWVMEKWLSPQEICPQGREHWDREYSVNGPFPDRGDYFWCHTFETCTPAEANLQKLISWIDEGKNRPYSEVRKACAANYAAEDRDVVNMQDAAFRDALPAFGVAPMVGRGGGRGSKTAIIRTSAAQQGLPTKTGMTATAM